MAYITISAGWNANHQLVAFLNADRKSENKSGTAFYQENEKPRVLLIDRKGAASIDSYADDSPDSSIDSSYGQLHADPFHPTTDLVESDPDEKMDKKQPDEELVETEVVGWDGDVEVHRKENTASYGWSKLWDKNWTNFGRKNLVVLPELHMASPPEMTSFLNGYERISESKYLDDVEEDIRVMAEECDRIEGFIYLSDGFDGFSGVTEKISEFNSDEYGRKSILFSLDEPWNRVSPYSLICQSLSLQNPCSLNVPLCDTSCTTTEGQRDNLLPMMRQIFSAVEQVGISQLAQFLVPFQQKILSTYSADVSKSPFAIVNEFDATDFESSYSWARPGPVSRFSGRRRRRPRKLPSRVLTTLSMVETGPINKPRNYSGLGHRDMSPEDTVCLWYNNAFSCAARSIVKTVQADVPTQETRFTSLRNSNEIHGYVAELVSKVSKFSPRLTGFEQDDWLEKIENLENIRDQTRDRPEHSSDSSDSD